MSHFTWKQHLKPLMKEMKPLRNDGSLMVNVQSLTDAATVALFQSRSFIHKLKTCLNALSQSGQANNSGRERRISRYEVMKLLEQKLFSLFWKLAGLLRLQLPGRPGRDVTFLLSAHIQHMVSQSQGRRRVSSHSSRVWTFQALGVWRGSLQQQCHSWKCEVWGSCLDPGKNVVVFFTLLEKWQRYKVE